ncbi:MAG: methyltransferase [Paracoccaceae bacterium]
MSDLAAVAGPGSGPGGLRGLAGSRRVQAGAARFPLTRPFVRREGAAIFDLLAGFCHSQALSAAVTTGVLDGLVEGPVAARALTARSGIPEARLAVLLGALRAMGLARPSRGLWIATARGAALQAVPGLTGMIAHHGTLYGDLSDPAAFFRGRTEPDLAGFWPYVFGAGAAKDPKAAARYSRLMADSQVLVAEDTLALSPLRGVRCLLDVGGGTGAFARAAMAARPGLRAAVFDLPAVVAGAQGVEAHAGSFRDDPLPGGFDAISLVRVLYDHDDATVAALLARVRAALPRGGRLLVSEPMGGSRAGDGYFALYCLAMRTGRVRRAAEIAALLRAAGFAPGRPRTRRDYVTTVIAARAV